MPKSAYVTLDSGLTRGLFLRDNSFQPRDVLKQALAGQNQEVIAELRILKVDFEQPVICDGQHLSILDTFDRSRSPVVGRKEAKLTHDTSRRKFDADLGDQKSS